MKVAQICNSHGFPHAWTATKYYHKVFRDIVNQIEENYDGECIVVDGTWLKNIASHETLEMMYPNVTRENIEHIFYVDLVDPPDELFGGNSKEIFTQLTTARNPHSIPTKSEFQFWAYFVSNEYTAYKDIDLPWTGNKLFLSYNRKPYDHRVELVRSLTDSALHFDGIITLGNDDPTKALTVDENVDIENANILGNVGVPNDIASIGDHNAWQRAFINVVTETVTTGRFLSEKIWKPIVGKRPFLLLGPPGSLHQLQELGFKTFENFWDESYQEWHDEIQIEGIRDILVQLSMSPLEEQKKMYKKMQGILEYNHNYFFEEYAKFNEHQITRIIKDEL